MKITKILATAVALCALCLAGCTDDAEQPEQPGVQPGQQVTMTPRADAATPDTRVSYTDDGSKMLFSWNANDKISVNVNGVTGNENCELKTIETGKSVNFSGTVTTWEGEKTIYAIHPYKSGNSYPITNADNPATATTTLTLGSQYYDHATGKNYNFFMVGTGKATASGTAITASAAMKQVMSSVVVNMANAPGSVKEVKLTCEEAVFPTKATVKLSTGEIVSTSDNVKELTLSVYEDTYAAQKSVFFALFPAELTGKKIKITVTCGNGTTRTIEKDGTKFERNAHYVMDFDNGTPEWDNFYPSVKKAQEILKATTETANKPDGKNHVFEISSAEQLAALHVLFKDKVPMPGAQSNQTYNYATYKLTTDIDLKDNNWRPIGNDIGLRGTFDGQGHTISGLNVSGRFSNAGLFSSLKGTIKNLMVKGNVSSNYSNVGGIVGENIGTIAFCSFEGTVSSNKYVGGICGDNTTTGSTVTSCFACVEVSGQAQDKGGIVGSNNSSNLMNPTNGKVEGCTWYYNENASTGKGIKYCYGGWSSSGDRNKNASFADTDGLSARLNDMNSYSGDYQWAVEGTTLKLVNR